MDESSDWSHWWAKMPSSFLKPVIVEGSSVALGHLLTSKSFNEFCELTGLEKEAALLLLRRVASKTHSLMTDE